MTNSRNHLILVLYTKWKLQVKSGKKSWTKNVNLQYTNRIIVEY
jgi:hypothetical protein